MTIVHLWRIFHTAFMKKNSRYYLPSHITLNNCIPHETRDYVRGKINIGHRRGHNCIILFIFEEFYEEHRRLLSENYYFR